MIAIPVDIGARRRQARSFANWMIATMLIAALGISSGCAGLAGGSPTKASTASNPSTYGISGAISPTTGGAGATVSLSGAFSATSTADSSGAFSFSGLANGTYAVTPSHAGYAFIPNTQGVIITGANVTGVNFTVTPQSTHSVSLSWGASPTTGVAAYNIYRSTANGSLYARIASVQAPTLSYSDSTVQNSVTYYYVATAVDGSGYESVYSNQVTAVIP